MSVEINEKLVDQIASQIKTQDDLADFSRLLSACQKTLVTTKIEGLVNQSMFTRVL